MNVKPDDLANLCAIFSELRTRRIGQTELQRYICKSMPIDGDSPCHFIIGAGCHCGLIEPDGDCYFITDRGNGLSKRQKQVNTSMSERAKDYMLKYVYLNVDSCGIECADFLLRFQVDTDIGTFVFFRDVHESHKENQWLKTLSLVGFLDVDKRSAKVRLDYLPLVNELLLRIREGETVDSYGSYMERNKVGDLAERLAMGHEKRRLSDLGLRELCPLVQRISLVDNSAGYDIASFRGTGRNPENRIYIEVKGTKKPHVDFIWSRNERRIAGQRKRQYWLYIYTHVDTQRETGNGPFRINNPSLALSKGDYIIEPIDIRVSRRQSCSTSSRPSASDL